ncbi:site-specific integrase [Halosimplex rubrum]|uniref:Site-specific integrase n=1 Tax=Halosimplex rubrum TaxID=869889 RepID=A0A7D5TP98_9EURY|nr:site-specific integrase [Halosimplex rubrum]QLH77994.1 site-specific integrase [Halosimplex rubrum]
MESLQPEKAVEMYLQERSNEVSEWTYYSHQSRLGHFLDWCEQKGVDNLNELTGRDMHEYKLWRRESGISKVTEKTQMDTLRVFIRYCERIEAVQENLSEAVQSPDLDKDENVRDEILEGERAIQILEHLEKYEYASFRHTLLLLMFKCGMRLGGLHSLDLSDYDESNMSLHIEHRPETETPLKNKEDGSRLIALSSSQCRVLSDYIDENRHDVEDDFGRKPLLTRSSGRPHKNTIRNYVYQITRPCMIGDCPHGRDPDECDDNSWSGASSCPATVSPHSVRRGSITYHLLEDVPDGVVSDRMNVGQDTLDKHYDKRSLEEKMEQRRDHLQGI